MNTACPRLKAAFQNLKDGNERFANGLRSIEPLVMSMRLHEFAEKGQSPFAVIITCSDSRVPTETIFDRGVGDLFVIRVAGNVITPEVVASVEFAAMKFGSPLALVMGHSCCGAIQAAIDTHGCELPTESPHLNSLLSLIAPSVPPGTVRGDAAIIPQVVNTNIERGVSRLFEMSPILRRLRDSGEFQAIGSCYDLATGRVQFGIGDQAEIVAELISPKPLSNAA